MKIDFFFVGGKAYALAYIEKLTKEEIIDAFHVIKQLSQRHFSEVGTKKWQDKIYEVYFKRHNRIFFTLKHNKIYILYACRKKKCKTTITDRTNILRIYKLFTQYVS